MSNENNSAIPLLKVSQELDSWGLSEWVKMHKDRPVPPRFFYVGSISLSKLRGLCGARTRTIPDRKENIKGNYQRVYEEERATKIMRYIEYGFPLSKANLEPNSHRELINPGWLPNSILINVIGENQERYRNGKRVTVATEHLVKIVANNKNSNYADLIIPEIEDNLLEGHLAPLEVIDGQHRLFAIDKIEDNVLGNYQVPVVLFDNLDLSWQTYLFWVINVEPKRINPSLAFDLYPELRDSDWLNRGEGIGIYQEHRSQELVDMLWRHPASPWKNRIELLGKRVPGHVSNAAAIRSLKATFVRNWPKQITDAPSDISRLGGLFGSVKNNDTNDDPQQTLELLPKLSYVIPWNRPEQAAFLIYCWIKVRNAVKDSNSDWAKKIEETSEKGILNAFEGSTSLLATDMGFRAVCFIFNAIFQLIYHKAGLLELESSGEGIMPDEETITEALEWFEDPKRPLNALAGDLAETIVNNVDWRTSSDLSLTKHEREKQGGFRGSSGYKALNTEVLLAATKSPNTDISTAAINAINLLGWTSALQ